MAALGVLNVQTLYNQGGPDLMASFALRNINAGDTLDLSITDVSPAFQVVRLAVLLSVGAGRAAVCTVSGTVVTMPAGLNAAGAYLVVTGV